MPPAFVGAFTTLCEKVSDVDSVTGCAAGASGGAELAMKMGNAPPSLGIDIGDVEVAFGFGFDVFPPPLVVLRFFGAGSP